MKKNNNYKIISLGYNCQVRKYLTKYGLIENRSKGRLSMPFDLAVHPTKTVTAILEDDSHYFDEMEYLYSEKHKKSFWQNKKYNIRFMHDDDCHAEDLEKIKARYSQRYINLQNEIKSYDFIFFIHYTDGSAQDVNKLYEVLFCHRAEKPFKLIIWDLKNLIDEKILNENVSLIKLQHPFKNIETDWWDDEKQTQETETWKKQLMESTKNIIEQENFKVKYYKENSYMKLLKKILNYHYDVNQSNIIIRLQGRMANQMFEWAFSKNVKKHTGIQPLFDDSDETQKLFAFNMDFKKYIAPKPLYKTLCRKLIPLRNLRNKLSKVLYQLPVIKEEKFCKYEESLLNIKPPVYLEGYFQSYKYLENIREELLQDFKLTKKLNRQNKELLKKIQASESVSVHFRRTDYLKQRVADIFGYCDTEYYLNGIKIIAEKCEKTPTLFIFSDDINWIKNNVKFDYETVYVDVNSTKQGYFDLELMKNCKHNIIANSSFSYWGAWLNENPNKIVIAPEIWMKSAPSTTDLLPPDWIRLGGQK